MDWVKAKSILILIFFMLNIYLITNIIMQRQAERIPVITIEQTVQILEERGIILSEGTEIPAYNKKTPLLVFGYEGVKKNDMVSVLIGEDDLDKIGFDYIGEITEGEKSLTFYDDMAFKYENTSPQTTININDENEVDKYLKSFIQSIGMPDDQFVQDEYQILDNTAKINYTGQFSGYLVYDNYVNIVVSEKGVIRMEGRYRKINGFDKKEVEILPAYLILLKKYSGEENVVIENIELGFKGISSKGFEEDEEFMTGSYSPAWRITYNGGKYSYFMAYDGLEIK